MCSVCSTKRPKLSCGLLRNSPASNPGVKTLLDQAQLSGLFKAPSESPSLELMIQRVYKLEVIAREVQPHRTRRNGAAETYDRLAEWWN